MVFEFINPHFTSKFVNRFKAYTYSVAVKLLGIGVAPPSNPELTDLVVSQDAVKVAVDPDVEKGPS